MVLTPTCQLLQQPGVLPNAFHARSFRSPTPGEVSGKTEAWGGRAWESEMLKKAKRAPLSVLFSIVQPAVYNRRRQYSDSDISATPVPSVHVHH